MKLCVLVEEKRHHFFRVCVCVAQTGDRERELLLHTIFCLTKFDLVYYDPAPCHHAY